MRKRITGSELSEMMEGASVSLSEQKSRCPFGHRLCDCLAWRMQTAATLREWRGDFLDRAVGLRFLGFLVAHPGAA